MAQKEPKHDESNEMIYNIRVTTKMHEIRSKMHEIRSTVRNVSKVPLETKVISPDFYLSSECPVNIGFKKDYFNLYVYICNKSHAEIKFSRTIALKVCNDRKLRYESDEKVFSLKKGEEVDVIGKMNSRSCYDTLPNDTLIIDISVSIKEIVGKRMNHFLCQTNPRKKLRDDLKTMLENPANSDVCLQVGDQRISAHWSVLCSRSPFFKRMFDSQMKESVQNSINITDLSLSTVKRLLHFLYTADFIQDDNLQELFDLYYDADKYEVMDLRTLCACKIMNDITVDNSCQILQLAHRHNDTALKKEVADFIQSNFNAVFQTDGWKKLKESEPLAAELFEHICSKKN